MTTGYSDPVNHALAFAAKHHDQRVRQGTRPPYSTQPANVAVILTRYGRDETTVIGGILADVVADLVREGSARELVAQRIGDKFGQDVLDLTLSITERRTGDAGAELSALERRADFLARLGTASEAARWVVAATLLHNAGTLLSDLRRTVEPQAVWSRLAAGREGTTRSYRRLLDRLHETGFDAAIMQELSGVVTELESWNG